MIARRIAIAVRSSPPLARSARLRHDGKSRQGSGGVMNVPLAAQNEVPPNSSTGSGTVRDELDKATRCCKLERHLQRPTGPVTAGHFHGPAQPGANAGVVVPFTGTLTSPIVGSGDAHRGADGRPGRQASGTPTCTPPRTRAARSADRSPAKPPRSPSEAPPVTSRGAFAFSASRRRSTRRCTLPVVVIGSASMNSISFGYS